MTKDSVWQGQMVRAISFPMETDDDLPRETKLRGSF
jgi:hypothetical protein